MRSHTLALLLKNNIDDIEAIRIYLNFGRILRKCPPASLEVPVDIEKSTGIARGAGGLTTDIIDQRSQVFCDQINLKSR